jgi:hypothetical protein
VIVACPIDAEVASCPADTAFLAPATFRRNLGRLPKFFPRQPDPLSNMFCPGVCGPFNRSFWAIHASASACVLKPSMVWCTPSVPTIAMS